MNSFAELGTTGNRHEGDRGKGTGSMFFQVVVKLNNGDIIQNLQQEVA